MVSSLTAGTPHITQDAQALTSASPSAVGTESRTLTRSLNTTTAHARIRPSLPHPVHDAEPPTQPHHQQPTSKQSFSHTAHRRSHSQHQHRHHHIRVSSFSAHSELRTHLWLGSASHEQSVHSVHITNIIRSPHGRDHPHTTRRQNLVVLVERHEHDAQHKGNSAHTESAGAHCCNISPSRTPLRRKTST